MTEIKKIEQYQVLDSQGRSVGTFTTERDAYEYVLREKIKLLYDGFIPSQTLSRAKELKTILDDYLKLYGEK